MEETKTPTIIEQHLRNAVDFRWAMALTATPEQIEQMIRRDELFDKGLEVCQDCGQESRRELENYTFCRQDKLQI